jgi:glycosyltransferase involved in cell wall biosynthesis
MPDVSVVIPTYNRRDFLPEAVASCFKDNESLSIEVVVVDDGSTDGTRKWLRAQEDDRIRPVFREHKGAQQARNAGLEAAQGDTIKYLDSDDYLYAGVLTAQYETLTEAEADVCYGPIDIVDGDGNLRGHKPNKATNDLLGGIATGTVATYPHVFLYRSEVARCERWRREVPYHQDTVYALDVAVHNPSCTRTPSSIGVHRIHAGSRIANKKSETKIPERVEKKFMYLMDAYHRRMRHSSVDDELLAQVARGLWGEAHKIAPYNFRRFVSMYSRIQKIAPGFSPSRPLSLLQLLDWGIGPAWTERIINPFRITKLKLGRASHYPTD